MAHLIIDEPVEFKLHRPGAREKMALRDLFAALEPIMPMLRFLADTAASNPELADKNFELTQTGISVPLRDVVKLLVLMDRIGRDLLSKE